MLEIGRINDHQARVLRVLGCYWQTMPHSGMGEDFLVGLPFFFFYGNIRDSETKSKKIDPKVRNEPSLQGLQTGRWQNLGWYGKKRPFLGSHHVLAMTGKKCANKKVPFSQMNISLLANFGCFFVGKSGFLAKKTLFGQT